MAKLTEVHSSRVEHLVRSVLHDVALKTQEHTKDCDSRDGGDCDCTGKFVPDDEVIRDCARSILFKLGELERELGVT